jgi:hypothetical protein
MAARFIRTPVVLGLAALLTLSCGSKSPTEPTPVCSASLSAANASYTPEGGSGSVTLSLAAGCPWTAASAGSWVAVTSGASGSGSATITYAVSGNMATGQRETTLTIAGQPHRIAQEGRPSVPCTFAVTPTGNEVGKDAVEATFSVDTAADCAWSASSRDAWLTVVDAAQRTGSGVVRYAAARNLDIASRTGSIVVADATFTLTQLGDVGGCQYSVVPVSANVCMAAGTVTSRITTHPSCPWSAATDVPWMTLVGSASGQGSADVQVAYGENYDSPRSGVLMLRWPTATEGQNVHLAQAGCRYAVTQTAIAFAAPGGTGTFGVVQQSDPTECGGATQDRCVWSAVPDVPWITITSSMPRSGDNPVAFTVSANPSGVARVGTIRVRDKAVVITQSGS